MKEPRKAYIQVEVLLNAEEGMHVRLGKLAAKKLVERLEGAPIVEGEDLLSGTYTALVVDAKFTKTTVAEGE
ncbi:MAG: hypothetical protein P1V51_19955 [Deltaproteobacteria bacterium]|nr:hypothetical protein [Deltaproteobacteria bacterium]